MLIFISGSINSGKTTTAEALARKIGADVVHVDDLNDTIPNFNLATDLDKSMDLAIVKMNESIDCGRSVVANYVLRQQDYDRLKHEVKTNEQYIITLAPRIEVAQSKRGDRELSEWEVQRIKHHYDRGIASPSFGHIIDNSDIGVDKVVARIMAIVSRKL